MFPVFLCGLILEADANEVFLHNHMDEMPNGHDDESPVAMETLSQAAVAENLPVEQPKVGAADQNFSEDQPEVETATGKVTEMDTTAADPDLEEKSVRGRKAKTVVSKAANNKQEATEHSEDPLAVAPVRGRRGKKTEGTAESAVRQTTRNRNSKTTERKGVELTMEEIVPQPSKVALNPKRGRNTRKACGDQADMVQEVANETEMVPEAEREQIPQLEVNCKAIDHAVPHEKAVLKPKQSRNIRQQSEQSESVPELNTGNVPNTNMAKGTSSFLFVFLLSLYLYLCFLFYFF